MNDRTAGTANGRPQAAGPESLMQRWNDEAVDAAGRAALDEIQRRLEETWDVEAGLQEILLADHYDRAVESQEKKFDVDAGLAEIVSSSPAWAGPWVGNTDATAVDYADAVQMFSTCEPHAEATFQPKTVPEQPNLLERIKVLAARMLTILEEVRQADGVALVEIVEYAETMSYAVKWAEALSGLPYALDRRLVTREQAVDVVDRASGVCVMMYEMLRTREVPQRPMDLDVAADSLRALSQEVFGLRVAVARLFDPSDDLVDVLL
ncbi:hypothetical protein AB0I37_27945 [Micromonospora purpureochromogenes]|uniref:hypothetical protein n=1 Tax=Micromonospora purpureochromogenes TaxID=47872 RepID=UPI003403BD6F